VASASPAGQSTLVSGRKRDRSSFLCVCFRHTLTPMDANDDDDDGGGGGAVEAALREVLAEEDLDAEEVLAVLVRTLADRHVDVGLRRAGRRPAWTPGNERTDAMVATMDALHEFGNRDAPDVPRRAEMQRTLFRALSMCMAAAQHAAGLDRDDDDPPTHMRLVTD
jgi:hypothetical protein